MAQVEVQRSRQKPKVVAERHKIASILMLDRENHNSAGSVFSGGYSPTGWAASVIQTEAQLQHFPGHDM